MEINTAVFNPVTRLFTVKTEKGTFENVPCVGAYDNYREMDSEVAEIFKEELSITGLMAYLHDSPEDKYLFYYPDSIGGVAAITRTV